MNNLILILSKNKAGLVKNIANSLKLKGYKTILITNVICDPNKIHCDEAIYFDWDNSTLEKLKNKLYIKKLYPEKSINLLESLAFWNKKINQEICNHYNKLDDIREILSDKILFRTIINDVLFQGGTVRDLLIKEINFFPCVLKPSSNSGGSRHVYSCKNKKQLLRLLHFLYKTIENKNEKFIIESYIEGHEYSVDGYVKSGIFLPCLYIEKLSFDYKNNQDGLSMITPPIHLKLQHILQINSSIQKIVDILKIENMWLHAEFRVNKAGAKLIEINPRFGGRLITSAVKYVKNIDPLDYFIHSEIGLPLNEYVDQSNITNKKNEQLLFISFKSHKGKLVSHTPLDTMLKMKHVINGYIVSGYNCPNYKLENFFAEFLVVGNIQELKLTERVIRDKFSYHFEK